MNTTLSQHIESTPGVCGGKPRIVGSRIRVEDVYVWFELQGKSAEEIVADFPQLTMSDVFAAMSYYWDHRDEIHHDIDDAADRVEKLRRESGPGPLARKLASRPGP